MRGLIAFGFWSLVAGAWAGERPAEDFVMQVTLTKPVTLPVVVGDRQAGSAKMEAGKTLDVVDVARDVVLVEALGSVSPVPRDGTDLVERMKTVDRDGPTRRDLRDALKHRFPLVGMTPDQIIRIMGPPQRQEKIATVMRWWYPIIGDVPRVNSMTIKRTTPETAPQIIPGGYRMFRGKDGIDYAVREPPVFYPGFFGESFEVHQETTEKATIGDKLLVFQKGRLVEIREEFFSEEPAKMGP